MVEARTHDVDDTALNLNPQRPPYLAKNHWKVLGLQRGATVREIKKAYKRQALRFHPDRVTKLSEDKRKKGEARYVVVKAG
jgi:curved DNA-binding protein CbpA